MSRRSNWNRASYKNNNRGGRPHGLRGKDIGLYYRDLQRSKNKNMDLDFMVNKLSFRISTPKLRPFQILNN